MPPCAMQTIRRRRTSASDSCPALITAPDPSIARQRNRCAFCRVYACTGIIRHRETRCACRPRVDCISAVVIRVYASCHLQPRHIGHRGLNVHSAVHIASMVGRRTRIWKIAGTTHCRWCGVYLGNYFLPLLHLLPSNIIQRPSDKKEFRYRMVEIWEITQMPSISNYFNVKKSNRGHIKATCNKNGWAKPRMLNKSIDSFH